MKRTWITCWIGLGGFAAGLLLPVPERGGPTGPADRHAVTRTQRLRETRKRAILADLFDRQEQAGIRLRNAANLSEIFGVMEQEYGPDDETIARMIEMDPAAAMSQLLADYDLRILAGHFAAEWASRDPRAAIRFLRQQPAYQVERELCKALVMAYAVEPELVGETLRAMDRRWQARNLQDLFRSTSPLHPMRIAQDPDPFADFTPADYVPFGADLLDCLADEELRNEARKWLGNADLDPFLHPDPVPSPQIDPDDLNPALWTDTHEQALKARWKESPEETLAEVAENGGFEARRELVGWLIAHSSAERELTDEVLRRLEEGIQQLGVVPESLPWQFRNPVPWNPATKLQAEWLARQPLALQRAWAGTYVAELAAWTPQPAIDWARTLPPGSNGDLAAQRGLIVWAYREPMEAAKYVEALPPGDLREAAISDTAATWACLDPAGARTWLGTLPASPGKTRGMERVK